LYISMKMHVGVQTEETYRFKLRYSDFILKDGSKQNAIVFAA